MTGVEVEYRYPRASSLVGRDLALETWTPTAPDGQRFFAGFVMRAEVAAAALLSVAKVARHRYYTPMSMISAKIRAADPVVTCDGDRIRFESLSVCCGVYARFDLLSEGLDGVTEQTGTTNVDVNTPLRDALGRVGAGDPMHLDVGAGELRIRTMDDDEVERKVDLPSRWLKSFAEVASLTEGMQQRFTLSASAARSLVLNLPSSQSRGRFWIEPRGSSARLTPRPTTRSVHLSAPERLHQPLDGVLRHATSLDVSGPEPDATEPTASAWTMTLPGGRFSVVLSPDVSRAFSGEGTVLGALGDDIAADDAELVESQLSELHRARLTALTSSTGLDVDRCRRALSVLSAAGRVGFDVADGEYFDRVLPFEPAVLESMHPRLTAARQLVAGGAVSVYSDRAAVRSGDTAYELEAVDGRWRCTCAWEAAHHGTRGPCKHALAVSIVERE